MLHVKLFFSSIPSLVCARARTCACVRACINLFQLQLCNFMPSHLPFTQSKPAHYEHYVYCEGRHCAFQCLTIRQQFTMYLLPACMSLTVFTVFLLVTFYRDSMLLATMALLTSIIVRGLKRTSVSAPVWISGLSNWVLMNRFGQILIFHSLYPKVRLDFTFTYIYSANMQYQLKGFVLCGFRNTAVMPGCKISDPQETNTPPRTNTAQEPSKHRHTLSLRYLGNLCILNQRRNVSPPNCTVPRHRISRYPQHPQAVG